MRHRQAPSRSSPGAKGRSVVFEQRDNHRRLARAIDARGPFNYHRASALSRWKTRNRHAIWIKPRRTRLLAGLGEALFTTLAAALVGCAGEPGITSDGSSVPEVTEQDFPDEHVRTLEPRPTTTRASSRTMACAGSSGVCSTLSSLACSKYQPWGGRGEGAASHAPQRLHRPRLSRDQRPDPLGHRHPARLPAQTWLTFPKLCPSAAMSPKASTAPPSTTPTASCRMFKNPTITKFWNPLPAAGRAALEP